MRCKNVHAKLSANIIPTVVEPDADVCQTLQMITPANWAVFIVCDPSLIQNSHFPVAMNLPVMFVYSWYKHVMI